MTTINTAADIYALGCLVFDLFAQSSLILFRDCKSLASSLRGPLPQQARLVFGKLRAKRCEEGKVTGAASELVSRTVCEESCRLSIMQILDRCRSVMRG